MVMTGDSRVSAAGDKAIADAANSAATVRIAMAGDILACRILI